MGMPRRVILRKGLSGRLNSGAPIHLLRPCYVLCGDRRPSCADASRNLRSDTRDLPIFGQKLSADALCPKDGGAFSTGATRAGEKMRLDRPELTREGAARVLDKRIYMVGSEDEFGDQHVFMSEDFERARAALTAMRARYGNAEVNGGLGDALRAAQGDW